MASAFAGMLRALLLCAGLCFVSLGCLAQPSYRLNSTVVDALRQTLTGDLLAYNVSNEPDATQLPTFDLWSTLEDGPNPYVKPSEPALYVEALDANDVVEALRFAAQNSLRAAVLGAGHQVVGVQLLPNGLTIDTKNLSAIDVDGDSQTAYVGAGVQGADLIAAIEPYNLQFPTGHYASVGVAGVVLGGGLGAGANLWGASVDSVLGIDVVSTWLDNPADWSIVRINATSEPDLFWGMLGGGAFLATAVGLELQLHPLPEDGTLPGVTAVWPLALGGQAFQWFYEWRATAPMEFEVEFATATLPAPVGPVALVDITNWDPDNSSDITAAFQDFITQAQEHGAVQIMPTSLNLNEYIESYTARVPSGPLAYYINDRFLPSVPQDLAQDLLDLYANATSPYSVLLIAPTPPSVVYNNSDTAFGWRDGWYIWVWPFWFRSEGGAAVDGDADHIAWAAQGGEILDQYAEGHYINMNRFDTPESTETSYPSDNWARLVDLKAQYDPHSLFRPLDYYRTDDGMSGIAGDSDY